MLANFFGKSNLANFIVIFLLFLCYATIAFFSDFSVNKSIEGIFMSIGLHLLTFSLFNFILAKNKLTLYNSYGFFFLILLFGIFPFVIFDRQTLLLNVILLLMLRRVYSLRTPKDTFKKIFDSGLCLGTLFILNPFTLVFGVLVYSAILLFKKLNLRTFFIPMVGFSVPLVCYVTYCFWHDKISDFTQLFTWYTDYDFNFYTSNSYITVPLIFIGTLTILSIFLKTPKVILISGNYRNFWVLVIVNFIVAIGFILITKERNGSELMFIFFPTAVILTNGIEGLSKRFFQDVILILFVLISILVQVL